MSEPATPNEPSRACESCLARPWLLAATSGHLDRVRAEIDEVLALTDRELITAVGGRRRRELARRLQRFDPAIARRQCHDAGLALICRCDPEYPRRLRELEAPPAVLHVAGTLDRFLATVAKDPVAIVGSRLASPYGVAVAHSLGRGLAASGLTVISGMAFGIDSAAHGGAMAADGATVAVLPGSADRPYPRGRRNLYRQLTRRWAAVSELPPGTPVRRWMFPSRNRIVAALAAMTVVVEAGPRSGALLAAAWARRMGRPVGAVPGRVTTPQAIGPNELLADGAQLVRGTSDVLDSIFGAGARCPHPDERPELEPEQRAVLQAIEDGRDTPGALTRAGVGPAQSLAALASLELAGYIRREAGGRFALLP